MKYIKLTVLNLGTPMQQGDPSEYDVKVFYEHIGLMRNMGDRTILVVQGQKILVKQTEKEIFDQIKHVEKKDAEWKAQNKVLTIERNNKTGKRHDNYGS